MNIFVAGVHGVGKTFLASQLPKALGLMQTSASKLIKEERALPDWGTDKRVGDVDVNQIALANAVTRHNEAGTRLLLDGHFVLLDAQGEFSPLAANVFKALRLDGVLLLEADANTIATRILERDSREVDIDHTIQFLAAERAQAELVCNELGIPLHILEACDRDTFAAAVATITFKAGQ
jgi:adenylate kinase